MPSTFQQRIARATPTLQGRCHLMRLRWCNLRKPSPQDFYGAAVLPALGVGNGFRSVGSHRKLGMPSKRAR